MNYLLSILIIAVLASQATIWHSLATIRDAIQQTNAIILAACGSDERPCQVAAHRGQIELGEIMVRTRTSDGFSCSRHLEPFRALAGARRIDYPQRRSAATTAGRNSSRARDDATLIPNLGSSPEGKALKRAFCSSLSKA